MGATMSSRRVKGALPSYCETNPRLTPGRIELVRMTWKMCLDNEGRNGSPTKQTQKVVQFYDNFFASLFDLDDDFHQFFNQDMEKQGRMLFNMIGRCIEMVKSHNMKGLKKSLSMLAKKHQGYGVAPEHYGTVGLALLLALEMTLGTDAFNEQAKDAWVHLYSAMLLLIIPHAAPKSRSKRSSIKHGHKRRKKDSVCQKKNSVCQKKDSLCQSRDQPSHGSPRQNIIATTLWDNN